MSRLRDLLIKIKLLKGPFTSFTHAVFFFFVKWSTTWPECAAKQCLLSESTGFCEVTWLLTVMPEHAGGARVKCCSVHLSLLAVLPLHCETVLHPPVANCHRESSSEPALSADLSGVRDVGGLPQEWSHTHSSLCCLHPSLIASFSSGSVFFIITSNTPLSTSTLAKCQLPCQVKIVTLCMQGQTIRISCCCCRRCLNY